MDPAKILLTNVQMMIDGYVDQRFRNILSRDDRVEILRSIRDVIAERSIRRDGIANTSLADVRAVVTAGANVLVRRDIIVSSQTLNVVWEIASDELSPF